MNIKKVKSVEEIPSKNDNYGTPFSGGNAYHLEQELKAQETIDKSTIPYKTSNEIGTNVSQEILNLSKDFIDNNIQNIYFLLQYQADYFCNTIRFSTRDYKLAKAIKMMIRGAFFWGRAALIVRGDEYIPILIAKADIAPNLELENIEYIPLTQCLSNPDQVIDSSTNEVSDKIPRLRTLSSERVLVFNWNTQVQGAYIRFLPFIKFQQMMLKQVIINSLSFTKKWCYHINNTATVSEEMKALFDPLRPFIMKFQGGEGISNTMTTIDYETQHSLDFITYYRQAINSFYELLGRQTNSAFKKERSTSKESEVEIQQYKDIQNEWLSLFKIFVNELNDVINDESVVLVYE